MEKEDKPQEMSIEMSERISQQPTQDPQDHHVQKKKYDPSLNWLQLLILVNFLMSTILLFYILLHYIFLYQRLKNSNQKMKDYISFGSTSILADSCFIFSWIWAFQGILGQKIFAIKSCILISVIALVSRIISVIFFSVFIEENSFSSNDDAKVFASFSIGLVLNSIFLFEFHFVLSRMKKLTKKEWRKLIKKEKWFRK